MTSPLTVDLGPRAEHDPLARQLCRRVTQNVSAGGAAREFARMWGTVVIVRRTWVEQGGSRLRLPELTLRFDYGHLVVHGGRVGRPDVTLWGSDAEVLALGARVPRWARLPLLAPLDSSVRRLQALRVSLLGPRLASVPPPPLPALGERGQAFRLDLEHASEGDGARASTGLAIFGRLSHPRFVYRLARVLAPSDEADRVAAEAEGSVGPASGPEGAEAEGAEAEGAEAEGAQAEEQRAPPSL
jgi:hypothetical protein